MVEMFAEHPVEMDVLELISDPNIDAICVEYAATRTACHYLYTLTGLSAQGDPVRELAYGDAPAAYSATLDFMLTAVGYIKTGMATPLESGSSACHYIRR